MVVIESQNQLEINLGGLITDLIIELNWMYVGRLKQ